MKKRIAVTEASMEAVRTLTWHRSLSVVWPQPTDIWSGVSWRVGRVTDLQLLSPVDFIQTNSIMLGCTLITCSARTAHQHF